MLDHAKKKAIQERLEKAPAAEWVRDMHAHYQRTGAYRARDIHRLVGSQTDSVKFDGGLSLAKRLSALGG